MMDEVTNTMHGRFYIYLGSQQALIVLMYITHMCVASCHTKRVANKSTVRLTYYVHYDP